MQINALPVTEGNEFPLKIYKLENEIYDLMAEKKGPCSYF